MNARYYALMASLSPLHLLAAFAFLDLAGRLQVLPQVLAINALFLIVANLLGARWLLRPIAGLAGDLPGHEHAARRLRRLPILSAAWAAACVVALMVTGMFVLEIPCPGCNTTTVLSVRLTTLAAFTAFCSVYIYFAVTDFTSRLRTRLFEERALTIPAGSGSLVAKLALAFVAVSVIPLSLAFLEEFALADARRAQGLDTLAGLRFDLLLTLMMSGATLVFIARTLLGPIRALRRAAEAIGLGRFDVRVAVTGDDEIGHLQGAFDAMAEGLENDAFVRETFGRCVPAPVAEAILTERGAFGPRAATCTVLVTDIEGFTTITEAIDAVRLVEALNAYFSLLAAEIERHDGIVTQFQGDAILAVFNLPLAHPDHAAQAVRAAVAIERALERHRFAGLSLPKRIGITTGEVIAGPVGAETG